MVNSVVCASTTETRDVPIDEVSERYAEIPITALNHAMVVKLYYPYTQFPRNVRLSHRLIVAFSAHRDFLIIVP